MPRPKNNSHKEFDNEKKKLVAQKFPTPHNNFSNGPPLNEPMNLSWTRIHHRHPKLTLWVRYANLTFLQESRCHVLEMRRRRRENNKIVEERIKTLRRENNKIVEEGIKNGGG